MKYGAHIYIYTRRWDDDQFWVMDRLKERGADVIEIAVGDDVHFDAARARVHAESLNLEIFVSPGAEWPAHCDLSADSAEDRKAGVKWHKKYIDLGAELGAVSYNGAIYGRPGIVKRRIPPRDEYQNIAEGLHELAEHAQSRGVSLALEASSHFRTHVANRPEQIMELIRLADHDNLQAILDTYHMFTEIRSFADAIHCYGDRLFALHCCENDRGVPKGDGLVPWSEIFTALQEISFDGYLMLEAYNSADVEFAHQRGMYHDVCPDADNFVSTGFSFLRQGLEGEQES